MTTPTILVRQMLEMSSDGLPERWQQSWCVMDSKTPGEKSNYTLQEWLEEMYFDGERNEDLTREDILKVGELVRRMLRFEPSMRTSAREILQDSWFKGEQFSTRIDITRLIFYFDNFDLWNNIEFVVADRCGWQMSCNDRRLRRIPGPSLNRWRSLSHSA